MIVSHAQDPSNSNCSMLKANIFEQAMDDLEDLKCRAMPTGMKMCAVIF
jgi:hypothetical protein